MDAAHHAAPFRIEIAPPRSPGSGKRRALRGRAPPHRGALGLRDAIGPEPQPALAPGHFAVPPAVDAVGGAAVASHPPLRLTQSVAPRQRGRGGKRHASGFERAPLIIIALSPALTRPSRYPKTGVPAKAGTDRSAVKLVDKWSRLSPGRRSYPKPV